MAVPAEAAALTAQHRTAQLALRALVIRDLTRLWPVWTIGRVATYGEFVQLAAVLIAARHQESSGLAAGYYRSVRRAYDVTGADTPRLAARLALADIAPSLRATGLAGVMRALRVGFSPQAASRTGLVQVAGAAGRLVLNGGRDTVLASAGADGRSAGWRRVTAGDPCKFCQMLAGRGPAYKGERTAAFQAHDHCACTAEPVFDTGT